MGLGCRSNEDLAAGEVASRAMDRYACGDTEALSELYDALAPKLRRYFVRHTRDAALADDLLQQTFLNMHCARASFREGADVVPWAFAIGHRLLIDEVRRGRHRGVTVAYEADDVAGASNGADHETPERVAASMQLARRLDEELARLPDGQRVAFELVRLDGLSMAEAAEIVGTTANALKIRAHRAYEALRAVLES